MKEEPKRVLSRTHATSFTDDELTILDTIASYSRLFFPAARFIDLRARKFEMWNN